MIEANVNWFPNHHYQASGSTYRRLTVIPDKEGKARVIAIFDYWSQLVLRPLHTSLAGCLRRLDNDCTFNQSNFRSLFPMSSTSEYFSIDLKAATDRMPVVIQEYVLSLLYDQDFAKA